MVSKSIFASTSNLRITPKVAPKANTTNLAEGKAYNLSAKHTLAQVACTGTFNGTFYANGNDVLKIVENAIDQLQNDPEYIAKVAIYARKSGYMKDLPSYITAKLADLDKEIFRKTFRKVIDNGKMLRNVVQIARSGKLNKKYNMSAGTYRHALQEWFNSRSVEFIFKAAIGNDPSMKDIIKMAHPKPNNDEKSILYRYLIGKEVDSKQLPEPIKSYELYRKGVVKYKIPDVDFRYLTDLNLNKNDWIAIAEKANWTMTRMNLNTFHRHGVFDNKTTVKLIANRLRDKEQIQKANVFPYQLFTAFKATEGNMPFEITEALQDAMEIAVANTPVFEGEITIAVDVSGSMSWSSITGDRGNATSATRPIDVAALFSASILRKNPAAKIIPFSDRLYPTFILNTRDTVLTNAKALASIPSGGTNCSLVLKDLNNRKVKGDSVIYISDNESWINNGYKDSTGMMTEWVEFKKRNPAARLVLLDLTCGNTSQVTQHDDILQVGGFSDNVFNVVNTFLKYGHDTDHWVSEIEKIVL